MTILVCVEEICNRHAAGPRLSNPSSPRPRFQLLTRRWGILTPRHPRTHATRHSTGPVCFYLAYLLTYVVLWICPTGYHIIYNTLHKNSYFFLMIILTIYDASASARTSVCVQNILSPLQKMLILQGNGTNFVLEHKFSTWNFFSDQGPRTELQNWNNFRPQTHIHIFFFFSSI